MIGLMLAGVIISPFVPSVMGKAAMGITGEISGNPVSWGDYFIHNFPLAILYGIISFALVMIILRPKIESDLAEFVNTEYKNLGPLKTSEKNHLNIESKKTIIDAQAIFASSSKYVLPAGFVKLWAGKLP